jgi:uncharacterized damage-inducible protein DinB
MKIRSLVRLAFVMPVTLVAQQPPAAASANPITEVFRGRTMALHRNIAQAFDSIPADKFGYKPTPAQQTIGFIAQHLVTDNYLFCNAFGDMNATRAAKETETADSVKALWAKDTLVAQLKASFDFCERAFAQLSDSSLGEQATLTLRGQTRNVTRASMVLGHTLDMADHYSQLANYMRLNGMLPPTGLPRTR